MHWRDEVLLNANTTKAESISDGIIKDCTDDLYPTTNLMDMTSIQKIILIFKFVAESSPKRRIFIDSLIALFMEKICQNSLFEKFQFVRLLTLVTRTSELLLSNMKQVKKNLSLQGLRSPAYNRIFEINQTK